MISTLLCFILTKIRHTKLSLFICTNQTFLFFSLSLFTISKNEVIELEDYSNSLVNNNTKSRNITISKVTKKTTANGSSNNHVNENGLSSPTQRTAKNKINTLDYEQQLNLLNSYKNLKKSSNTGSSNTLPQGVGVAASQPTTATSELDINHRSSNNNNNFDEIMFAKNSNKKSLPNSNDTSHSSRRTSQSDLKEKSKSETRGKSTSLIKRLSFKFKSNSMDKSSSTSPPSKPSNPSHSYSNNSSNRINQPPVSPPLSPTSNVKQRNGDLPPQSPVARSNSRALRSLHNRTTSADEPDRRSEAATNNQSFNFSFSQKEEDINNNRSSYENDSLKADEPHLNIESKPH